MESRSKLKVLVLSFDWDNIFETDFGLLKQKLERNKLGAELNNFYFFNWSNKTYYQKKDNSETSHFKFFISKNRVLYDLLSIFVLPVTLFRRRFRPDIIWTREFQFVFSALIPKLLFGSKIIINIGSDPKEMTKTKKFSFLQKWYQVFCENLAKYFVDYYVANGKSTKSYLLNLGIQEEKITIMTGNVIDRDSSYIKNVKKGAVREKYNIPTYGKIILSVGRLEPEKGYERLINSFSKLKRKDLFLIIVGKGILDDKLKELVESLKIQDKVIFAGYIERTGIWDYYADADIFTLLSYSEGCPTVVREAMYMGVPVIGSRIDGVVEFIGEDSERGFYWEEGKDEDFEENISVCLDREGISKIIREAREYVIEEISDKRIINDII